METANKVETVVGAKDKVTTDVIAWTAGMRSRGTMWEQCFGCSKWHEERRGRCECRVRCVGVRAGSGRTGAPGWKGTLGGTTRGHARLAQQ